VQKLKQNNFFFLFSEAKKETKMHFKFSEDFFHFTALHENHRLHFATCCVPVSAIAIAKAGNALPQVQRLNLGKFRGSGSCELDRVLRAKNDLSSGEIEHSKC
jgi:hypothetical protein